VGVVNGLLGGDEAGVGDGVEGGGGEVGVRLGAVEGPALSDA
jgi:hypothetical protein